MVFAVGTHVLSFISCVYWYVILIVSQLFGLYLTGCSRSRVSTGEVTFWLLGLGKTLVVISLGGGCPRSLPSSNVLYHYPKPCEAYRLVYEN